jgi:tetratricopeptide (TPR) repeat protein
MEDAANYYQHGGRKSDGSKKRTYLDEEVMSRESASKYYRSAGKTDLAIDTLKQAVEVAKANDSRDKIPRLLEDLLGLLKGANRAPDHHVKAIEYVNFLKSIGKIDRAAEIAKEEGKWCRENSHFTQAIDLLGIAKELFKGTGQHKELAEVFKEIGRSEEGAGRSEDSISSSVDAGRSYLKARMMEEALDCFGNGELLAHRKPSKLEVGMYCLKDVAIESLVPENCDREAREWIDKAAGYFANNVRWSVTRIEYQIQNWKHKNETEKCGWAYYCLWLLYNKAPEKGVALSPADEEKKKAAYLNFCTFSDRR